MALLDAVTSGEASLVLSPVKAPETYAVIAKAYDPAIGALTEPPLAVNKLDDEEYIELKIASKDVGLFFNSFSSTVVFKLRSPSFSVLTPRLDKYTPFAPNPVNWVDVSEFNCFWMLLITGSSDKSPASSLSEPLKVFSLSKPLASLTAVIKDCRFVVAELE